MRGLSSGTRPEWGRAGGLTPAPSQGLELRNRNGSSAPLARSGASRGLAWPAAPALRGSVGGRRPGLVAPQIQQRTPQNPQGWLRQHNSGVAVSGQVLPARDAAGNFVPRGTTVLHRGAISGVSTSFGRIRGALGQPTNGFAVRPRTFRGRRGEGEEREFHHHAFFFADFFYPFYFSDPFWLGFDYPGFYPSIYSFYGWGPGWIYPDRTFYQGPDYFNQNPYSYYYSGSSGLDYSGVERAIGDIRQAWLDSNISLLSAHLTDQVDIRVYFDGEYDYSTSTNDYYAMTADTMATVHTVSMDFGQPVWISPYEVFYTGTHSFTDPNGVNQTVYVSYRLRHVGSDWFIVGVGTSREPIQSHYTNFWED